MATNTPIPSAELEDFVFNKENFDRVLNENETTYTDRFGVARPTLKGFFDKMEDQLIIVIVDIEGRLRSPAGAGMIGTTEGSTTVQDQIDALISSIQTVGISMRALEHDLRSVNGAEMVGMYSDDADGNHPSTVEYEIRKLRELVAKAIELESKLSSSVGAALVGTDSNTTVQAVLADLQRQLTELDASTGGNADLLRSQLATGTGSTSGATMIGMPDEDGAESTVYHEITDISQRLTIVEESGGSQAVDDLRQELAEPTGATMIGTSSGHPVEPLLDYAFTLSIDLTYGLGGMQRIQFQQIIPNGNEIALPGYKLIHKINSTLTVRDYMIAYEYRIEDAIEAMIADGLPVDLGILGANDSSSEVTDAAAYVSSFTIRRTINITTHTARIFSSGAHIQLVATGDLVDNQPMFRINQPAQTEKIAQWIVFENITFSVDSGTDQPGVSNSAVFAFSDDPAKPTAMANNITIRNINCLGFRSLIRVHSTSFVGMEPIDESYCTVISGLTLENCYCTGGSDWLDYYVMIRCSSTSPTMINHVNKPTYTNATMTYGDPRNARNRGGTSISYANYLMINGHTTICGATVGSLSMFGNGLLLQNCRDGSITGLVSDSTGGCGIDAYDSYRIVINAPNISRTRQTSIRLTRCHDFCGSGGILRGNANLASASLGELHLDSSTGCMFSGFNIFNTTTTKPGVMFAGTSSMNLIHGFRMANQVPTNGVSGTNRVISFMNQAGGIFSTNP